MGRKQVDTDVILYSAGSNRFDCSKRIALRRMTDLFVPPMPRTDKEFETNLEKSSNPPNIDCDKRTFNMLQLSQWTLDVHPIHHILNR